MLKVNELFAGIGAFRKALIRTGIPHEIIGISEIDKYAIKSYEAIYGETRNYGDISKVYKLEYADLWTYGFPCQDISIIGLQKGIVKSETRSGLLFEVKRLLTQAALDDESPKYLIMENVKNLVGKKFKTDFIGWCEWLNGLGYNNYWQVLNASDYGIPQSRERVFCISIRKDIDTGYNFPTPTNLSVTMEDVLQPVSEIDRKYFLSEKFIEYAKATSIKNKANGCGFLFKPVNRYDLRIAKTITTKCGSRISDEFIIEEESQTRRYTPLESWRLMGFDDEDFHKARVVNSDTQLYKQAGNTIVVNVLEAIAGNLLVAERSSWLDKLLNI